MQNFTFFQVLSYMVLNYMVIYSIFLPYCESLCQKLSQYGEKILPCSLAWEKNWRLAWDQWFRAWDAQCMCTISVDERVYIVRRSFLNGLFFFNIIKKWNFQKKNKNTTSTHTDEIRLLEYHVHPRFADGTEACTIHCDSCATRDDSAGNLFGTNSISIIMQSKTPSYSRHIFIEIKHQVL